MKASIFFLFLLFTINASAQKDCEYSSNVTDSLGTYKSTKDCLMHQRIFGNSQTSVFFSLINADGLLSLNFQMVQKSSDFIAARCFDKNSKIYIQLNNGKIVTLIGIDQESCGNSIYNNNETSRILSGYFLFMIDSFQELKNSPISFIRVKFSGETIDYIGKSELVSELNGKTYAPDHFFMDYLKCVE
ncbi:hypothetical protein [Flavobacterium sp.]|uniref:hypothetical protein n=1 Tax=Flavobacterium sp. TaxID=239 RepID=UPI0037500311